MPNDEIKIDVTPADQDYIRRRWKVDMNEGVKVSITQAREKYVTYLKRVNGTANKEVWQVYDHLTADIFNDVMVDLMKKIDTDLDQYCEKIIYDEFQI